MQSDDLERIRMLDNRMRKPSRPMSGNEESVKTIKSTDSQKLGAQHRLPAQIEEYEEVESESHRKHLDDYPQSREKKKITDYFCSSFKHPSKQEMKAAKAESKAIVSEHKQPELNTEESKVGANTETDLLREQNRLLKQKMKMKDSFVEQFKQKLVDAMVDIHKMRRNQIRARVSQNKVRLGQYFSDKQGKEVWVDGLAFRETKEKIENILRQKEELERSKKQVRKVTSKESEEAEEIKNSIASQTYFLSREEIHCHDHIKRLQEEKALHLKEYKLLFEEEHSRYGKLCAHNEAWPAISKYQLLGLLGKGGFSEVYKAYDTEELREVACKVHEFKMKWSIKTKENYVKHALRQNSVHKRLSHPNIVKLYDTVEMDSNSFCTVLEYCEGPDLSYYLKKHKKIPQKQAKMIIRQVVSAIKYLHELPDKVIHYDLKPQNILFHKGKIKITDFGLCKTTKEDVIQLTSQGVGTYWYLSPECFETDKRAVITPKVDIWSIGVIFFEMLFGQKPFGNQMNQMRILHEGIMLKASHVNFPKGPVSSQSKDFIKDCLKFNVEERADILALFNHRLFQRK